MATKILVAEVNLLASLFGFGGNLVPVPHDSAPGAFALQPDPFIRDGLLGCLIRSPFFLRYRPCHASIYRPPRRNLFAVRLIAIDAWHGWYEVFGLARRGRGRSRQPAPASRTLRAASAGTGRASPGGPRSRPSPEEASSGSKTSPSLRLPASRPPARSARTAPRPGPVG